MYAGIRVDFFERPNPEGDIVNDEVTTGMDSL